MAKEEEFKLQKISWQNIGHADEAAVKFLRKNYKFLSEDDILEILPPIQRPKFAERTSYLFMILLFPHYNRSTKKIELEEIDFFIGKRRLVTVSNGKIPALADFMRAAKSGRRKTEGTIGGLVGGLLQELLNHCFPMLRHINLDIAEIEKKLFSHYLKKSTVEEILRIKTNIVDFERAVRPQEFIFSQLIKKAPDFFGEKNRNGAYNLLLEYSRDIGISLESYKDAIDALHEADSTLIEFRMNHIIKTLTIISVITFPLTLFATLFSMKAEAMPIVGSSYDFWKIIGLLAAFAVLMLLYFKKRKWI